MRPRRWRARFDEEIRDAPRLCTMRDRCHHVGAKRQTFNARDRRSYRMIPMDMTISPVDENPSDAHVRFLEDCINQYNVETTKIGDGRIMSYLLRDERADIVGGLYGWTWSGTCEIRYLWVREDFRKRGFGKALMEAAEREAIARGCNQIVLDTHSFQAPLFYKRLGFEIIASHADYPRGHYKHYLRKQLIA